MNPVGIQELQNRPRYDLDGRRYGNTLSDDMFSIKNPQRENQHTPESYDYLDTELAYLQDAPMSPAMGWDSVIPTLKPPKNDLTTTIKHTLSPLFGKSNDFRDNGVSRNKTIGEGKPWETQQMDWDLLDDINEFPDLYTPEQVTWAENTLKNQRAKERVNDLSTEGLREDLKYQRTGDERDSGWWINHEGAEYDPYYEMLVNYNRMSPRTAEQLVKMGVNRPTYYGFLDNIEDEALRQSILKDYENGLLVNEASDDPLMGLINAYKYAMENR